MGFWGEYHPTVLQAGSAEIQKEADLQVRGLEFVHQLTLVSTAELGQGLGLDDDAAVADEIGPILRLQPFAFVLDRQLNLPLKRDMAVHEFKGQRFLINRLQKSVPKFLVNSHRRPNDRISPRISRLDRFLHIHSFPFR